MRRKILCLSNFMDIDKIKRVKKETSVPFPIIGKYPGVVVELHIMNENTSHPSLVAESMFYSDPSEWSWTIRYNDKGGILALQEDK